MANVITVDEALAILRRACAPGAEESVPLREGLHRVLAREVRADVDWPPFDTSAMDGYAIRLDDLAGGSPLRERPGLVAAGDRPPAPLAPGEAVRVMTGAPIPDGCEAIVPVEDVRREGGTIATEEKPRKGEHIRRRGESVVSGALLLEPGRRLSPAGIALAALAGADPLTVRRRARVTIAVTGNELVATTEKPGPGQLRDSNGPMLLALCRAAGWPAAGKAVTADEDGAVRHLFAEAGRAEDMLVTSGGVSAGDLDLLPAEAERAGFEILFHGVALRPGKPIAFGRRGATLWFGLPGNPVSTSVCFHVFVRYALDCLEGVAAPGATFRQARLEHEAAVRGRREAYVDAILEESGGEVRATPVPTRGSHDLGAHGRANALIRIPAGAERLAAGSVVDCLMLAT
jgi:molybdopterin molybdotransferase